MRRVLISVEGQTEETFVQAILVPHFSPAQLYMQPVLLKTRHLIGIDAIRDACPNFRAWMDWLESLA